MYLIFTLWRCRKKYEKLRNNEVHRAGLILDIGEGSAPNLRHFPGCRRVPGTCQSDFCEDFFFFMFSIVFNTFIKKGKNEYIFKENPKMKVGALLKIYNLRYYRSFLTEKCLCYNQKRKFFALSFSLWWCRNIKEKLWNWLTYAEMKTGPSHSVRHQHLQTCWQLTNQQQWNNFISLTLYLWKKQSGMFRAPFDTLESVGLSTVSNVNCQQCSDILHIEDF